VNNDVTPVDYSMALSVLPFRMEAIHRRIRLRVKCGRGEVASPLWQTEDHHFTGRRMLSMQ